jgi:hypothetical protein
LWGIVLDRRRDDEEAVLARRALARERGQARVEAGEPCAFGVARDRPPFRIRQVVAEPGVALCKRLRMSAHGGDAVERTDLAQDVVPDVKAGLADDREGRREEQIERSRDHALAGILDRDDAEVGGAGAGGVEDLVGIGARQANDRRAEVAERGELAERARRPEVGDPRRRLERAARRHDLAPDRRDARSRQGALFDALSASITAASRSGRNAGEPSARLSAPIAVATSARRLSRPAARRRSRRCDRAATRGRQPAAATKRAFGRRYLLAGRAGGAAAGPADAPAGGTPRMVRILPSSAISFGSRMGGISATSFWLKLLRRSTASDWYFLAWAIRAR